MKKRMLNNLKNIVILSFMIGLTLALLYNDMFFIVCYSIYILFNYVIFRIIISLYCDLRGEKNE